MSDRLRVESEMQDATAEKHDHEYLAYGLLAEEFESAKKGRTHSGYRSLTTSSSRARGRDPRTAANAPLTARVGPHGRRRTQWMRILIPIAAP